MLLVHLSVLVVVMGALFLEARAQDARIRSLNAMTESLTMDWARRVDVGTLEKFALEADFIAAAANLDANNKFSIVKQDRQETGVDSREFQSGVSRMVRVALERGGAYQEEDRLVIPVFQGGRYQYSHFLRFRFRPPASAYEPLRTVYLILLAGMAAAVLLTGLALRVWVLDPLKEVARGADRVAAGDFSRPVPAPAHARDELGAVATSFNAMMAEVGTYRKDLEKQVGESVRKMRAAEKNLVTAQRLAAMGTLAAGIAHDINNPLGGMMNAARALAREDLPAEKRREYIALLADGLERVAHTVQKILQFSPHRVAPQACDLAAVADRALALARHRIEKNGIQVVVEVPTEGLQVFGDPYELQQVVLNLLVNAADAVEERGRAGGRIDLRGERAGGEVRLAVRDDGVGMSEDQVAKAFDLFYTTKGVGEGSGLGLSIVHTIIESHGGRVDIRSRKGEGTTVEIVLPVYP